MWGRTAKKIKKSFWRLLRRELKPTKRQSKTFFWLLLPLPQLKNPHTWVFQITKLPTETLLRYFHSAWSVLLSHLSPSCSYPLKHQLTSLQAEQSLPKEVHQHFYCTEMNPNFLFSTLVLLLGSNMFLNNFLDIFTWMSPSSSNPVCIKFLPNRLASPVDLISVTEC